MSIIHSKPKVPMLNRRRANEWGLVFATPFSEGGGFSAIRDAMSQEALSVSGTGTSWTKGIHGPALSFTKASGIQIADALVPSSADLTISGTFSTSSASENIFVSNNYGQDGRFDLKCASITGGTYRAFVFVSHPANGSFTLWGNTTTTDGKWHHLAATRKSGLWTIYLDGKVDASASTSNTISTPTGVAAVNIARSGPGRESQWMSGSIGNVEIFHQALTVGQIQQLANDPFYLFRSDNRVVIYSYPQRPRLVFRRFV